jgi:hypothetical protein
MLMGREGLDAQAAFERLPRVARSSPRRLVAREVTAGTPLPLANRPQPGPGPRQRASPWEHSGPDS